MTDTSSNKTKTTKFKIMSNTTNTPVLTTTAKRNGFRRPHSAKPNETKVMIKTMKATIEYGCLTAEGVINNNNPFKIVIEENQEPVGLFIPIHTNQEIYNYADYLGVINIICSNILNSCDEETKKRYGVWGTTVIPS